MSRIILSGLIAVVLATPAGASAFSDFNQGISAHNLGEPADTIRYMSAALANTALPAHLRPAALLDRGQAYAIQKQYDLALADYNALLALIPGDYTASMERGALHAMRKEYELARADFAGAIRARPDMPGPYAEHGDAFMAERRFDEALKDYSDGLAASEWSIEFYRLRSEAYRLSGRYDAAIKEDEAALAHDDKYAGAYIARGRAHEDMGELKAALSDYEKAAALESDNPELPFLEGLVQWKLARFDDAGRDFRRLPERSPYAFIWNYLADARRKSTAGDLADRAAKLEAGQWPAPVVKLIAGTATADEVTAKAGEEKDIAQRKAEVCEADFYVGEWQLLHGDEARAKAMLGEAARDCEIGGVERGAAAAELARLK